MIEGSEFKANRAAHRRLVGRLRRLWHEDPSRYWEALRASGLGPKDVWLDVGETSRPRPETSTPKKLPSKMTKGEEGNMDELQINTELRHTEQMDGRTVYVYESPWSVDELTTLMEQAAPGDLKVQAELDGEYREFVVLTQAEEDIWLILS